MAANTQIELVRAVGEPKGNIQSSSPLPDDESLLSSLSLLSLLLSSELELLGSSSRCRRAGERDRERDLDLDRFDEDKAVEDIECAKK